MRLATSAFILAFAFSLLTAAPGAGQEEGRAGFALTMDSQTLSGRPGGSVESFLTIAAHGTDRPTRYELQVLDLGQTPMGTTIPVERGLGARSCAGWIQIQNTVEVPPDGEAEVPFTLTIPPDASGGYYAFIQVRYLVERPGEARFAVLVQPTLSVKIEFEVPGTNPMELKVSDLSFEDDAGDGRSAIVLEIENTGQVKASVEGDVLLYKKTGGFPTRAEIPPDALGRAYVVYPGLSRSLKCFLPARPQPGEYRAEVRLLMARRWHTKTKFNVVVPPSGMQAASVAVEGRSEFDIDFDVKPEFVEVTLPRGATRTVTVRAINRDTLALTGTATVAQVIQEPNGFLTFADIEDSTRLWVRVSPKHWTLAPRSAKTLLLEITAPESAADTASLCAVRIVATGGMDAADWLSEADLGIPVIAVPPGSPESEVVISKLEIVRPTPERNPTAALVSVKNTGGRTARVVGKLTVERAGSAQRIQTMSLSGNRAIVLPPGVERRFRMPFSYLDKDKFRLKAEVSIAGKPETKKAASISFVCMQGPE